MIAKEIGKTINCITVTLQVALKCTQLALKNGLCEDGFKVNTEGEANTKMNEFIPKCISVVNRFLSY